MDLITAEVLDTTLYHSQAELLKFQFHSLQVLYNHLIPG